MAEVLQDHGCAIVTGVASEEDCTRLAGLFAQDLGDLIDKEAVQKLGSSAMQKVAAAVAENPRAWPLGSLPLLGNLQRCQLRGLPHGRFAWGCRLLPNVRRCYEAAENKFWPHVDHNAHDRRIFDDLGEVVGDWEVYQGLLYAWGCEGSHASTTAVLPGSHQTAYSSMMEDPAIAARGRKGVHFTQLTYMSDKQAAASLQDSWLAGAGRVPVPRGSLFLWSSKTLHQGWSGGPRLAQPVALDRKMRLAALGLPSTHWASLGIPHTLVAPEPCTASAPSEQRGKIALPLKATIRPASLQPEGRDVSEFWAALQTCGWEAPMSVKVR
eukprot:CAMPEP_0175784934 /NCGR_PEP_ID=MMETSP0097-20121207/79070_1 /TAXON_ID=311494 /ORGANISM="Alexandrium monilatum, Strain CCMP3105" /LENGTH=324 /DNA_ID=CAMNT_0017095833 /DNA_START=96 /DNA_END=1067 /DNA_ORIENTATION=+